LLYLVIEPERQGKVLNGKFFGIVAMFALWADYHGAVALGLMVCS
jgi:hypothetical protein